MVPNSGLAPAFFCSHLYNTRIHLNLLSTAQTQLKSLPTSTSVSATRRGDNQQIHTDLIQALPSSPKGSAKRDDDGTSTRQNIPHSNTQAVVRASSGTTVNPFATLPDELILEIWLLPAEDRGRDDGWNAQVTFASLALTCQYLHPFGMRYLYRPYRATSYLPRNNFLTTAYDSSNLIRSVREVVINNRECWPRKSCPRMAQEVLSRQIMDLAAPYKRQWLDLQDLPRSRRVGSHDLLFTERSSNTETIQLLRTA
jgi:hypothetical protein